MNMGSMGSSSAGIVLTSLFLCVQAFAMQGGESSIQLL